MLFSVSPNVNHPQVYCISEGAGGRGVRNDEEEEEKLEEVEER